MRRIIVGAIAFVLMFAQVPGMVSNQVKADGKIGYTKVWDTNPQEKLIFTPTVADDGSIYGVGGTGLISKSGEARLYKVSEGKVVWKSEEELQSLPFNIWPVILHDNLVIAAGGVDYGSNDKDEFKMMFVCYTKDGKKVWDKKIELTRTIPSFQLHDGNIWLVYDETLSIINPKTGEVTKQVKLSDLKPSSAVKVNDEGDDEDTDIDINMLTFAKDTMMLAQLKKIRSFKIGNNFDLKLNWQKDFSDESSSYGMVMNMLLELQANPEIFLVSESESEVTCFETVTGKEKWKMGLGSFGFGMFFYNSKNVVLLSSTGTSCYKADNKESIWESQSAFIPIAMSDDYIYTGALYGLDSVATVDIIDIKTGDKVSQVMEPNVASVVLAGDDIYLTTAEKICKYTKCDPCVCDVDAIWKSTGKTAIDTEICPLETKEFELVVSNTGTKNFVDCMLSSSSKKVTFSADKVRLEAGKSVTVIVKYSAGLNEPDKTDVDIKAAFSCNKEIELTLNVKKAGSCKEVLQKQYSLSGTEFNLFGNVLVYPELKRSGLFNVKFNGFKGVSIDDGKKLWSVGKDQLDGASEVDIEKRDGNLMVCHGSTDDGEVWAGIDTVTGEVVWKRSNGQPLVMDDNIQISCSEDEENSSVDLFDIHTGKNIISGLQLPCESDITPMCKVGQDMYIFESYPDESKICCDVTGKVIWNKGIRICNNWTTYKLDNFYLEVPSSSKEEDLKNDFLPFKLSMADPITLKETWTVDIVGNPTILQESKDKVWVSSAGGIYCFNIADGKLVWFDGDDRFGWNEPVIVNNSFCVERYLREDSKDKSETDKFLVIDPKDGSRVFEKEIKNYISFEQKDDLLYVSDEYYDEKVEMTSVHCFKIADWKLLWTATGKGTPIGCGSKMVFKTREGFYSWFEEGKLVGQFDTGSGKYDYMDFFGGSPCVSWVDDKIFITKSNSLFAVDAKTSKQLWKYSSSDESDQTRIVIEGGDWIFGRYYSTPCAIGDKILLTENNKLTVYKSAQ